MKSVVSTIYYENENKHKPKPLHLRSLKQLCTIKLKLVLIWA